MALPGATGPHPAGVAFSPDGSRLAASHDVDTLTIWQFPEGQEEGTISDAGDGSNVIAFDPMGEYLVAAGIEGIALFDSDGYPIRNLSEVTSSPTSSSPDGERSFFAVKLLPGRCLQPRR